MAAQVIPFPRAAPLASRSADERFTVMSHVRGMCIGMQLSRVDKAAVVQATDHWLDLHISAGDVEQRARWMAEQMLNRVTGGAA